MHQESVAISLAGNFVLLPLAFLAFFIYTQNLFENANPDPPRVSSYKEAEQLLLPVNECVTGDFLSQALYTAFQVISVFSYIGIFYYIVSLVVLFQSFCLIKAIVARRMRLLRQRDQES